MSKTRKVERVINMIGVIPEGAVIKVHNIQVRGGVPLPDLGERVIAMDEYRLIKFAGEVTDVDFEHHTYDAELRKSYRRVV